MGSPTSSQHVSPPVASPDLRLHLGGLTPDPARWSSASVNYVASEMTFRSGGNKIITSMNRISDDGDHEAGLAYTPDEKLFPAIRCYSAAPNPDSTPPVAQPSEAAVSRVSEPAALSPNPIAIDQPVHRQAHLSYLASACPMLSPRTRPLTSEPSLACNADWQSAVSPAASRQPFRRYQGRIGVPHSRDPRGFTLSRRRGGRRFEISNPEI
jgi:hypothetical protein